MANQDREFQHLELEQIEILDAQAAALGMQRRMARPQGFTALSRLDDEARGRGYRPATGPGGEFGLRQRFRSRVPVHPPGGEAGAPVQELQFEMSLRALEKGDSEDQAAVATVTMTAGQNTEEYDLMLEARGGNFAQAREFKVEHDRVVPTNSWWTAARSCVSSTCGSVCVASLVSCTGTWAGYLLCVAAACGGCWVRCAACATCDCRWWCRWGASCCHQ
jgi:hypothetical protein